MWISTSLDKMKKIAQISIEFVGILVLMFFIFSGFLIITSLRMSELRLEENFQQLKEVSNILDNEIKIALIVQDGYFRSFDLPERILGKTYSILTYPYNGTINRTTIIFTYANSSLNNTYIVLKFPNYVVGKVYKGKNNISKFNNKICVNNLTECFT